jgi:HNH endonuclease
MTLTRDVRHFIIERAKNCCEYCLTPQAATHQVHHIDHIIARQHGGTNEDNNLALCYMTCNLNKGPNLATFDPGTENLTLLFNPRKQVWAEHFRLEQDYWYEPRRTSYCLSPTLE